MNLYYFNPDGYGEEAFICAESKEKAIEYLKNTTIDKWWWSSNPSESEKQAFSRMINDMTTRYKIEEHPPGEPVFTD